MYKIKIASIVLCLGMVVLFTVNVKAQSQSAAPVAAENKAFLEKNKSQPGVVVLPSGLQYKIIEQGTGAKPVDSSKVSLNFTIKLINGNKVSSTYDDKQTWDHHLFHALKGWQQVLPLMPEGSKWIVYLPAELAFGDQGSDGVPPGSTLVCELELVKIMN